MDVLSILGVIIALAAIIGGNALEGGHIDALINGPALVIVFTVYQIVGFIKYRNKNKSKLKYYGKI